MHKKQRGIACIINARKFSIPELAERLGTDVDRDRLQELFQKLQFDVRVYNDEHGLQAKVSYLAVNSPTAACAFCLVEYRSVQQNCNVYKQQNVMYNSYFLAL